MSARMIGWWMRACTAGIGLGILAMIQPFVFDLFRWGFLLLLLATIGFTIVSHLRPRSGGTTTADVLQSVPIALSPPDSPPAGGS